LRRLIERSLAYVPVISQAEVPPEINVEILEVIRLTRE
jgi:flagellar biosynthesis protein FlhA